MKRSISWFGLWALLSYLAILLVSNYAPEWLDVVLESAIGLLIIGSLVWLFFGEPKNGMKSVAWLIIFQLANLRPEWKVGVLVVATVVILFAIVIFGFALRNRGGGGQ